MQSARFARKPLPTIITPGWAIIRNAIFCDVVDTGGAITCEFSMGFCSGTTNIPGDPSPTNALVAQFGGSAFNYAASVYTPNIGVPVKYVAGVRTQGGGIITPQFYSSTIGGGSTGCMIFVDIVKAGGYPVWVFGKNNTGNPVVTEADFNTQCQLPTPAFANHSTSNWSTIAPNFSEAGGTIDAACLYWNSAALLRVKKWEVLLIA